MPQKYTLEYLKENKVAVNCRTISDLQKVMDITKPEGWKTIADQIFSVRKEQATIEYYYGSFSYSDVHFIKDAGYEIIPAIEFLQDWEEGKSIQEEINPFRAEQKNDNLAVTMTRDFFGDKINTNATTIAAIRTHLTAIDNLLKTIE